jgi:BirA family biotin operon repressor/biotin-[acetyl-CoA-carboxylase] ligase
LAIGPIKYFDRIGSTNDEAALWAGQGAPHLALVVADEQTAGRGRFSRRWFTPPGAALAFSLVLRPEAQGSLPPFHTSSFSFLAPLGALAISLAVQEAYGLPSQIKWPNDVLVGGRKVAGILAEADWQGDQWGSAILGIGVNVSAASVPSAEALIYPATCLETELQRELERVELLRAILDQILAWLPRLDQPEFLQAWQGRLAFQGQWVQVLSGGPEAQAVQVGQVLGIDREGCLRLRDQEGQVITLRAGELRLRPIHVSEENHHV